MNDRAPSAPDGGVGAATAPRYRDGRTLSPVIARADGLPPRHREGRRPVAIQSGRLPRRFAPRSDGGGSPVIARSEATRLSTPRHGLPRPCGAPSDGGGSPRHREERSDAAIHTPPGLPRPCGAPSDGGGSPRHREERSDAAIHTPPWTATPLRGSQ
ncbi:hypothetical protein Mlg_1951 [Alkalilimnicola ehrlichii MLHE-1]|uniref:Uncharacterized protein n=1 Tax=Alkalilimnicola ehrlichii (strain ATCC BAA-1101 / DSM 17681 / MLHE-1) TaxID=187272 RepID=Q0A794_ALKEH|nr:hypothetical protein Mlg_1951 [Alkalilimnicola ehrlichii MLHE-1]